MATLQTTTAESPAGGEPNKYLRRDLIFIAYAALITTLSQTQVLGDLPIRKQLMNFGADETAVSLFIFWSGLAWYLKPAFGLVIDAFPLLGTRRRWYMISAAALAALSWGLAGYSPRWCQPGHYGPFL
ncbi:MAG: hypothetical protein JO112_11525, partial [Planctomycetes bacterium]|nr:hypothetical protein [Planctomycetota bacterium]